MINIKLCNQSISSDRRWTKSSGSNPGYTGGNVNTYMDFVGGRISHQSSGSGVLGQGSSGVGDKNM